MTDIRTKTIAQLPLAASVSSVDKILIWQDNVLKQSGPNLLLPLNVPVVTSTSNGLMLSSDKVKLDQLESVFNSIAALRANSTSYLENSTGFVKAYYANGTTGGGMFIRVPGTATDNGGTIITDAVGQRWARVIDDVVSVLYFGAVGDGVADDTAAIQNAINYTSGPVSVYLPNGVYKVTSTITISKDRVKLHGDGNATRILFEPTANSVCFLFDKGSTQSFQHTFRDITFYSFDTTYTKTAIKIVNVGSCVFENVQTVFPHWYGNGSVFLHILGRDATSISKITAFADKPILISPIPAPHVAAGIGIDHFHFQDCYLGSSTSNPLVSIDDDVLLSSVTFDGYQAWVGGGHGLYWNDTLSTGISLALSIHNVRHEQLIGTTGWTVYINRTAAALQNLNIKNLQVQMQGNGVYLRNTLYSSLENIVYPGSQTAFDINNTNSFCQINAIASNNTATINVSAAQLAGKIRSGGNVTEYLSSSPAGSGLVQVWNPSKTRGFSQIEPRSFVVGAGATVDFAENSLASLVFIFTSLHVSAVMAVNGTSNSTRVLTQSDAGWFGTSSGAANYNLFWDGGTSRYRLQNTTGSSTTFFVQTMGQGER